MMLEGALIPFLPPSLDPGPAAASARRAAEEAGRDGRRAAKASSYTGMSLHEARQILNVQDVSDTEAIKKVRKLCMATLSKSLFFAIYAIGTMLEMEGGGLRNGYVASVFYSTEL